MGYYDDFVEPNAFFRGGARLESNAQHQRKPAARGTVFKLSFDKNSGPPKKTWRFQLENIKTKEQPNFTIPTDGELWLETIVQAAYRKLKRKLGQITIIPTTEMMMTWSNLSREETP